jgi:hypothetical protein
MDSCRFWFSDMPLERSIEHHSFPHQADSVLRADSKLQPATND